MTAVKAFQAEAFLKSPDPKHTAFLFYGPDAGLIAERAATLADTLAKRERPEGDILRLDDTDLENEPDRLAIELGTIPMFGGRKIVRASTGRRINTSHVKPLIEGGPLAGVLIVEAGELRRDDALRVAFEKATHCAAIACYPDESRDLDSIVRDALTAENLTISNEARALLVDKLGADRVMSRSEIAKLVLYVHGKKAIDVADVEAIVGDASDLAVDRIISAAASGDAARTAVEFARAISSGESAQGIILFTERHFHRLHRLRAQLDAGRTFDDLIRAMRPQPPFKLKDALAAQCRLWTTPRLTSAIERIAAAAKAARTAGPLEDAHAERLLLTLALLAKARG